MATSFTNYVLNCARRAIPVHTAHVVSSSHPWFNERVRNAVDRKITAYVIVFSRFVRSAVTLSGMNI